MQRPLPNLTDGRADKLLDIETEARVLLRSSEIQIGDQYFLDEEVKGTRRRMLQCMGIRLPKLSGEAKSLHGQVQVIRPQSPGIWLSDCPLLTTSEEGCCRGRWCRRVHAIFRDAASVDNGREFVVRLGNTR